MEQHDLHLIIGKKRSGREYYPLTVNTVKGEKYSAKLHISISIGDPNEQIPSGYELGVYLRDALRDADLWRLVDDCFTSAKSTYSQEALLLVEIRAPELYRLPWENIFDVPELTYLSEVFTVVRYLSKLSSVFVTPLQLPIDALIIADSLDMTSERLPTDRTLRYFRATKLTKVSAGHLQNVLSHLKYDIIHMICRAEFRDSQTSVLFPGIYDLGIAPKNMLSLLKRCGARLLVLHGVDRSYGALLNFAHNILHADGPTIIATNEAPLPDPWSFDEIYMEIIHNHSLVSSLRSIPREMRPSLLLASGGADVLRISSVVPRLYAQLESQLQAAKRARDTLSAQHNKMQLTWAELEWIMGDPDELPPDELPSDVHNKAKPVLESLKLVEETIQTLEGKIRQELDYAHESGAIDPMTKAEMLSSVVEKRLRDVENRTKRVVNSWFTHGERTIGPKESLEPETLYKYEMQIGVASEKSNVRNAVAIPEEELARFYSKEGLPLSIVLYSSDFRIEQSEQFLTLPPPPHESNTVTFDVMTPSFNGIARMRACIYFEQNLIQSLLVQAAVGESKSRKGVTGNVAEVDYSLSGSLTNIERFPSRTLNIAVNDRGDGTHSFYIAGRGLKSHFDFGEDEIDTYVTQARGELQDICSKKDSSGEMRYRYGSDNRGNEKAFVEDVKALAKLGSALCFEIVIKQEKAFQNQLDRALGQSGAIIQISSTKSAKYVFPWALVYDKQLVEGNNVVCPQFLEDLKKGGPPGYLKSQICMLHGCPNEDDYSIICPSGFWGYKHIIEQPLSLETSNETGMQEVLREIKIGGKRTSVMMGVSLKLRDVKKHRQELERLSNVDITFMQTKQQIGMGLQRRDFHLIYFYCHGGRSRNQAFLGIGKGQKLAPRELVKGWRVDWPIVHPFVFINGCRTVDVTPNDFVDFNITLSRCGASGVMGTEITIPENLARYFASGFLQRFLDPLNGNSVGEAIRDQRFAMLENYNLLGLAYTPYCFEDLRLVHT